VLRRPLTNRDSLQRYFIAILPTSAVSAVARELQQEMMDKYNAKAALRSPPHITLHMPFGWSEGKEGTLTTALSDFFAGVKSFKVSIDGLGAFPPRVIFMNVQKTAEIVGCQQALARFCRIRLGLFNASFRDEAYHPHLTLAFRDLRKPAFRPAWEFYSQKVYAADFMVESVHLLKHDGREWKAHHAFELGSSQ
jgi:2'-5' RNA ligase